MRWILYFIQKLEALNFVDGNRGILGICKKANYDIIQIHDWKMKQKSNTKQL